MVITGLHGDITELHSYECRESQFHVIFEEGCENLKSYPKENWTVIFISTYI